MTKSLDLNNNLKTIQGTKEHVKLHFEESTSKSRLWDIHRANNQVSSTYKLQGKKNEIEVEPIESILKSYRENCVCLEFVSQYFVLRGNK